MNAFAKSKGRDKAKRCYQLLEEMKGAHDSLGYPSKPDVSTYATVLNACSFSCGGDNSLEEWQELLGIVTVVYKEFWEQQQQQKQQGRNPRLSSRRGGDFGVVYINIFTFLSRMRGNSSGLDFGDEKSYDEFLQSLWRDYMFLFDLWGNPSHARVLKDLRRATGEELYEELVGRRQ